MRIPELKRLLLDSALELKAELAKAKPETERLCSLGLHQSLVKDELIKALEYRVECLEGELTAKDATWLRDLRASYGHRAPIDSDAEVIFQCELKLRKLANAKRVTVERLIELSEPVSEVARLASLIRLYKGIK